MERRSVLPSNVESLKQYGYWITIERLELTHAVHVMGEAWPLPLTETRPTMTTSE
jgi:hypothetical protein